MCSYSLCIPTTTYLVFFLLKIDIYPFSLYSAPARKLKSQKKTLKNIEYLVLNSSRLL
jgi:hypothetical protein